MGNILKIIGVFSIVVLILILILIGCGDHEDKSETQSIYGFVFAASPISGAVVSVFDSNGVKLGDDETGENGSFIIEVTGIPEDFRVVATGGRDGPRDFAGELKTDVYNFDPEKDIIYVNILTTMVSAYLEKHPEKTIDEATTIIKDSLEIPQDVDIGDDLHDSELYFSGTEFIREAVDNGGVNSFIEILLGELDEDPTITHPFPGGTPVGGLAGTVTNTVVSKLIGFGLDQLLKNLVPDKDQQKLNGVLSDIKTSIQAVRDLVEKLTKQVSQQAYDDFRSKLLRDLNNMEVVYKKLFILTDNLTGGQSIDRAKEMEKIAKLIEDFQLHGGFPKTVIEYVNGSGFLSGGLLERYAHARALNSTLLNASYSRDLQDNYDYWEYIQILASTLNASYWAYKGDAVLAKSVLDELYEALTAERKFAAPLCEPLPMTDDSGPAPEFQLSCPEPDSRDCIDSNGKNICIRPIPEETIIDRELGIMIYHKDADKRFAIATGTDPDPIVPMLFGCDEWIANSCTSSPAQHCVYCNGYTFAGPHTYFHIFLNTSTWTSQGHTTPPAPVTYNFNKSGVLGFGNWRMPRSWFEVGDASKGWTTRARNANMTVREWAVKEGWPKESIDPIPPGYTVVGGGGNQGILYLADRTSVTSIEYRFLVLDKPNLTVEDPGIVRGCVKGYTQILESCSTSNYPCNNNCKYGGYLIPVRDIGEGETYYY